MNIKYSDIKSLHIGTVDYSHTKLQVNINNDFYLFFLNHSQVFRLIWALFLESFLKTNWFLYLGRRIQVKYWKIKIALKNNFKRANA
jgi:hypothetical protein